MMREKEQSWRKKLRLLLFRQRKRRKCLSLVATVALLVGMGRSYYPHSHQTPSPLDPEDSSPRPPAMIHTLSNGTHFHVSQRSDRVGAAIMDYFLAHAFTFRFSRIFEGACGNVPIAEPFLSRHRQHHEMLETMGLLSSEIPISQECPSDPSHMMIPSGYYHRWKAGFLDLLSPEWIDYLRQRSTFLQPKPRSKTVVVHIRRGDVEPCDEYTEKRYLPNSYYLELIGQHQTNEHSVIIHSQLRSWEPWTDYDSIPRLEMRLDAPTADVWRDIIDADVFIMSKSSYSQVPALFTRGTVICYPFHICHALWKDVDFGRRRNATNELKRLQTEKCATGIRSDLNWSERVKRMGESLG